MKAYCLLQHDDRLSPQEKCKYEPSCDTVVMNRAAKAQRSSLTNKMSKPLILSLATLSSTGSSFVAPAVLVLQTLQHEMRLWRSIACQRIQRYRVRDTEPEDRCVVVIES